MPNDSGNEISQDVEAKARELGWSPKEQWRGDPSLWQDAQVFVERSEHILPIVQANNQKLRAELMSLRNDLVTAMRDVGVANEQLKQFKESRDRDVASQVEAALANMKNARREAVASGDSDRVVEIDESMQAMRERLAKAKEAAAAPPPGPALTPEQLQLNAELNLWKAENPWYGSDTQRTRYADAISVYIGQTEGIKGLPLLKRVNEEVGKKFDSQPSSSKFDGGANGSGQGGGGSSSSTRAKGYADLSPEAKKACDKFEKQLVGPNKQYKTQADWRAHYAREVFAAEG